MLVFADDYVTVKNTKSFRNLSIARSTARIFTTRHRRGTRGTTQGGASLRKRERERERREREREGGREGGREGEREGTRWGLERTGSQ